MGILARIFIWVSLLFFLPGFAGTSNAHAVAKRVHANCPQLHLSKVKIVHHTGIKSKADDICVQDADDVDGDDHNDDVFVPVVLNYVAAVFLQQHVREGYLPRTPERPVFYFAVPRYILFHSLVIPPAA